MINDGSNQGYSRKMCNFVALNKEKIKEIRKNIREYEA
jgi:hypothetical protein